MPEEKENDMSAEVRAFLLKQASRGGKAAAESMSKAARKKRARKAAAASAKVRSKKARAKRAAKKKGA